MAKTNETISAAYLMELYTQACNGQMKPDGNNCAVCGDIGHQAFECRFNPFVKFHEALCLLGLPHYHPKP